MKKILTAIVKFLAILVISGWVGLFIFTHCPIGDTFTAWLVFAWAVLTYLYLLSVFNRQIFQRFFSKFLSPKNLKISFFSLATLAVVMFVGLTPSNQRNWQPEVSQMLDYSLAQDGKTLTLYNVRNFDWQTKTQYQVQWETRQYDLDKLQSLDFIASYWMGEPIAHTLVSFGFRDGKRVALSIEIRKQQGEEFSTWGGFFRNYEMIIVAADEKDIVYTRSNIRHEDVYIYPITVNQDDQKRLLLTYLDAAKSLKTQPQWYNTLIKNCTTEIFRLQEQVKPVPWDYRILVSGYSPNYLYDIKAIDNKYPFGVWRQKAYINPKTDKYSRQNPISSHDYSAVIRQEF